MRGDIGVCTKPYYVCFPVVLRVWYNRLRLTWIPYITPLYAVDSHTSARLSSKDNTLKTIPRDFQPSVASNATPHYCDSIRISLSLPQLCDATNPVDCLNLRHLRRHHFRRLHFLLPSISRLSKWTTPRTLRLRTEAAASRPWEW